MSDYNSSLPVRTEAAGDVDINVSDAITPANKLQINADGSAEVNQKKLDATTDNVAISDGTNTATVNVSGQVLVKDDDLDATTDNVAISDGTNTMTVNASGQALVKDDDLDAASDSVAAHLKDENGDAYSPTNPLPIVMTGDQAGDEICDYNTTAAIAKDASVNHDYTVSAGKTFLGEEAWISGSGKLKVELLINGATVFVGFNSTANPNIRIPMEKICKANAAEVIRMTITNRDNQAQDLYSTLLGLEV